MGKITHRRRIRGPLMQTALLLCFLLALLAQLGMWKSEWLARSLGTSAQILYWLRIGAEASRSSAAPAPASSSAGWCGSCAGMPPSG